VNEGLASFLPFIIIFVLFYFMLIRPQMKQAKERALIDNLKTGDEIISNSGILGKITKLSNQFAIIEVAKNVEIRIQKQTIQTLLPKGTIKSI
jgi:preprotein translocase subunit YajC